MRAISLTSNPFSTILRILSALPSALPLAIPFTSPLTSPSARPLFSAYPYRNCDRVVPLAGLRRSSEDFLRY
jgi:hypothetical protein